MVLFLTAIYAYVSVAWKGYYKELYITMEVFCVNDYRGKEHSDIYSIFSPLVTYM